MNRDHSSSNTFRIWAHNVFWFQGAPFATDQPPAPRTEILEAHAALYKTLNPDLLCLQEIQSDETAKLIAEALDMHYIYSSGDGYPQYGGVCLSRHPITLIPLEQGFHPDRVQQTVEVQVSQERTYRVTNIHLPSSRQRGHEGGQQQRLLEISKVVGKTDILIGDFNEPPTALCGDLLRQHEYLDAAELATAKEHSTNLDGRYRGDLIWISNALQSSFNRYQHLTREHLAIEHPEKRFLSDHFPIGITLQA